MSIPTPARVRTVFHITGCDTCAYPTSGGIVYKYLTDVELDYLGLSRTDPAYCNEDSAEEDAFALRMLQLGARWWPSRKFHKRFDNEPYPFGHHYPPDLHVGYTSTGGVLLLKVHAGTSPRLETDAPERPEDWARLRFAETMDQRCSVLKRFGAKSFEDLTQCDEIPKTLDAGVAEGRKYEQLLQKWDDNGYKDEWLNSL